MAQWVKNLTAATWVAVEVWVQSLAQCNGLKDPALWFGFNPRPRNFHVLWVQPFKKKKKKCQIFHLLPVLQKPNYVKTSVV